MGGSAGVVSEPPAGGALGPFCPASLAASVCGDGMLSVSELLLTAAAGWGEGTGERRGGRRWRHRWLSHAT